MSNEQNENRYLLGRVLKETDKAFLFETARYCVLCWIPKSVGTYEEYMAFDCTHLITIPEWLYWKQPTLREGQHPFYVLTEHPGLKVTE